MAIRDNATKSKSISKAKLEAVIQNSAISNFRKERRTLRLAAEGYTLDRTDEMISAIVFDFTAGFIDRKEADVVNKSIEMVHAARRRMLTRTEEMCSVVMFDLLSGLISVNRAKMRLRKISAMPFSRPRTMTLHVKSSIPCAR